LVIVASPLSRQH